MITVIDYGRGNLFSLAGALKRVDSLFEMTGNPDRLRAAYKIILPGVGAFGDAVNGLRDRGLDEPLKDAARRGVPILGICVGCQLMLDRGEEFGQHKGLGIIPGTVRKLSPPRQEDPNAIRVPNVGWRQLQTRRIDPIVCPSGELEMMYFVHSFAPMVEYAEDIIAALHINGDCVPVAIRRANVVGVQFHPEKSGQEGLAMLRRFASWNGA